MTLRSLALSIATVLTCATLAAQSTLAPSTFIRVDQFGYLPGVNKVAVLARSLEGYDAGAGINLDVGVPVQLVEEDGGAVVFEAYAKTWNGGAKDALSGDHGWWFDFSEVSAPGSYRIRATQNDGSAVESYAFRIGTDVYDDALRAAVNFFYYQRVNLAKTGEYAAGEPWTDGAWFDRDYQERNAKFLDDPTVTRDLSGGWIDAGDPNKYVTFASDPVHSLLGAYRAQSEFWDGFDLRIPESDNDIPDLLDEVQWELEWVKKMQDYGVEGASGGIHQKMGILNDGSYISPPSTDTRDRYFNGICVNSTITGAGMMAHAATIYADIPALAAEGQELTARAEAAWDYYVAAPNKSERCDDGRIEAGDADGPGDQYSTEHVAEAVVAAVYLFEATGDTVYRDFVEANFRRTRPFNGSANEWAVYRTSQGEAALHYGTEVNPESAAGRAIRAAKESTSKSESRGYRVYESDNLYRADLVYFNWGSNSLAGSQASDIMDFIEHGLRPELAAAHTERAAGLINYLHGTNPMGTCYLSNMYAYGGDRCADEMWHSWFRFGTEYDNIAGDNVGPAPGFLAGGANPQGNGAMPIKIGTEQFGATAGQQPPQKAFSVNNDPNASFGPWAYNEPAVYYNGNYIRALSFFAAGEVGGADAEELGADGETFEAEDINTEGTSPTPGAGASGGAYLEIGESDVVLAFTPVIAADRQITLRVSLGTDLSGVSAAAEQYTVLVNGEVADFALDTTTVTRGATDGQTIWGTIVTDAERLQSNSATEVTIGNADASATAAVDLLGYRRARAVPTSGGQVGAGVTVCGEAEDAFTVLTDVGNNASVERDGNSPGSSGSASVKLFDAGDAARVTFQTASDTRYEVRVRVRTGEASANSEDNLAGLYDLTLDGQPVMTALDRATISPLSGDTYWGELVVGPVDLAAGAHTLDVVARRDWLKLDRVCTVTAPVSGVGEVPAGVTLTVAPNPVGASLVLELEGLEAGAAGFRTEVFAPDGRRMYVSEQASRRQPVELGADRPAGVYLARVTELATGWTLSRAFIAQ